MSLQQKFDVKDYLVSGKTFTLIYDDELDLYRTIPVPPADELGKYYKSDHYISHTDSQQTLTDRLYQMVKSYNLKSKIRLINRHRTTKGRLLDIGAGTGDFLKAVHKDGWQITGVEPDEQARTLARNKLPEQTPLYPSLDALHNQTFDVITLWHVLEHVPDYNQYLETIKRLLTKDGLLVIAVPNFKSYDAQYYQAYWAAFDVPRHLWHFSQTAIQKILTNHQMTLFKIKPMRFDSFYVSMLSEQHKHSTKNLVKSFGLGLYSNLKAMGSGEYSSLIYLAKK